MVNQTSSINRLEVLLDTRSRTLKKAKLLVEEAITKVTQGLQKSHGIKVFQTMHILESLEEMDSWQAMNIGHHSLVDLIRECGYETVHWKSPRPCSRLLKVWRVKTNSIKEPVIMGGEK